MSTGYPYQVPTRSYSDVSLDNVSITQSDTAFQPQQICVSDGSTTSTPPEHNVGHNKTQAGTSQPLLVSSGAWLYEILSLVLAVVVLVALIAILAHFQDKQNPLWSGGITLNTVVSLASTLFRILLISPVAKCTSQLVWLWFSKGQRPLGHTVMFDQASRGVPGSLQILFSPAYRSIVSMGAIATIGLFVAGPFFQQSLSFYTLNSPHPRRSAYASSASTYNGNIGLGGWGGEPGEALPRNMKSAIYNGLLSAPSSSRPNPPFSCPSGNCTWDPFGTLAITAQCADTDKSFELNCAPFEAGDWDWDRVKEIPEAIRPHNCTFSRLNDTDIVGVKSMITMNNISPQSRPPSFWLASSWLDDRGGGPSALDPKDWETVPSGGVLRLDWARVNGLVNPPNQDDYYIDRSSTLEARSCHLSTSVHDIHARVDDGTYSETIHSTLLTAAEESNSYTYQYSPSQNFSIDWQSQGVLLEGVWTIIGGLSTITVSTFGFLLGENENKDGREIARMMYQSPNITNAVHNLAHHMSIALRSNDTILHRQNADGPVPDDYVADSHKVKGTVYRDQIHVAVNWAWLSLPVALTVLVAALLVATIFETRRHGLGIWKDSPLPLLLHSRWEAGAEPRDVGARTADEIAKEVKGLRARLVRDDELGGETEKRGIRKNILISRGGMADADGGGV